MKLPKGIVSDITDKLTESGELATFLSMSRSDMISAHMSLGMYIRNKYGLWNQKNIAKYKKQFPNVHPDDLSFHMMVEIQKVIKSNKEQQ